MEGTGGGAKEPAQVLPMSTVSSRTSAEPDWAETASRTGKFQDNI